MAAQSADFAQLWQLFKKKEIFNGGRGGFLVRNSDNLGIRNCESMLDIGAGCGEASKSLIGMRLSHLKTYIAVEPDPNLLKLCQQEVASTGKTIKVVTFPGIIQDYPGPDEPVDLILMLHVACYLADCLKEQLVKTYQWLNPGGCIIIAMDNSEFSRRIVEALPYIANSGININIFRSNIEELGYKYTEYEDTDVYFDITDPGDGRFLSIILQKYPTAEEWEKCHAILQDSTEPGTQKIHARTAYFCVRKC